MYLWKQKKIYHMDWFDLDLAIKILVKQIRNDNYFPTSIVAICRGGLIPAVKLSHALRVRKFRAVYVTHYDDGIYPPEIGPVKIIGQSPNDIQDDNVLLVDDIAGTGATLNLVTENLGKYNPKEIRSATLLKNVNSEYEPNYYCSSVDDFVIFPWEIL